MKGNKFIGEFKDDKKNGKGIYFYKNSDKKETRYYFDDRQISEKDYLLYNNSLKTETPGNQTVLEDKKKKNFSGKVMKKYNDGYYEGDFVDGLKEGMGTYYYENGDKYFGGFKNDEKDGIGAYYYNNGESYIGNFTKILIGKFKTTNFPIKIFVK